MNQYTVAINTKRTNQIKLIGLAPMIIASLWFYAFFQWTDIQISAKFFGGGYFGMQNSLGLAFITSLSIAAIPIAWNSKNKYSNTAMAIILLITCLGYDSYTILQQMQKESSIQTYQPERDPAYTQIQAKVAINKQQMQEAGLVITTLLNEKNQIIKDYLFEIARCDKLKGKATKRRCAIYEAKQKKKRLEANQTALAEAQANKKRNQKDYEKNSQEALATLELLKKTKQQKLGAIIKDWYAIITSLKYNLFSILFFSVAIFLIRKAIPLILKNKKAQKNLRGTTEEQQRNHFLKSKFTPSQALDDLKRAYEESDKLYPTSMNKLLKTYRGLLIEDELREAQAHGEAVGTLIFKQKANGLYCEWADEQPQANDNINNNIEYIHQEKKRAVA